MRRTHRHPRGGFTIAEALTAGAILALSAAVIGAAASQSLASLERAREYQRAAELLDRTLRRIDLIGPDRLSREGPTEGRFAPPDDRFSWSVEISPWAEGHLFEVRVAIAWATAAGQGSAEAHTLLNDPPGSRDPTLDWEDL